MGLGLGTGAFLDDENFFGQDRWINATAAQELARAFFAIDRKRRHDRLRIPLDRLDRANRIRDHADTAIDLGIALEALLLHKSDRGELSFRLSLRGAWLAGKNEKDRADLLVLLRKAYDLRGRTPLTPARSKTLPRTRIRSHADWTYAGNLSSKSSTAKGMSIGQGLCLAELPRAPRRAVRHERRDRSGI
jgi:hypothetical protein